MVDEPSWFFVIVLIHRINPLLVLLGNLPALDIIRRWIVERTYGTYHLYLWMLLLQGLAYHQITLLEIGRNQIFVTDSHHLQVEWSGMTGISSHLCPLRCGRVAIRPLHQVNHILNILRHISHRDTSLLTADSLSIRLRILARHTSRQHWQRLCSHILAPLEILIEAQFAGLVIVPDILCRLAVLQRSHALLPVIDVLQALPMKHAAARESYEARLQISDYLCQILAQSMSLIGILRHEAQHIHSHSVFALRDNGKTDILV